MSKIALYQKYRSSTFDEVIGQDTTVRTIKNAIKENKVGHAYLFCGPRGTGKTSMARLLAKAVNCTDSENAPCGKCDNCLAAINGTHPDIIEINAANETHVDDIRDLIERAKLAPMVGKHKVYIIDEVHQLSSAASSALLKILEEPPENVIFILATTDPQKLLPTIISRCQQYNFFRIKTEDIANHLLDIAEKEGILMDKEAAIKIAVLSNGGMRDALSIMDQCASFSNDQIREEDVDRIYGLTSIDEQIGILQDITEKNLASVLERIKKYDEQGIDVNRMTDSLIDVLKDVSVYSYTKQKDLLKVITSDQAVSLIEKTNLKIVMKLIDTLLDGKNKYKVAQSEISAFEVVCLQCIVEIDETLQPVQQIVVQEKVITKPIEEKKEVVDPIAEALHIDTEAIQPVNTRNVTTQDVVRMLLICNKDEKSIDAEKWQNMNTLVGLEYAKHKTMLKDVAIGACGKDIILLLTGQDYIAERINNEKENKELYFFLKKSLQIDKLPVAMTNQTFNEATKLFLQQRKTNTLPEPYVVEKYEDDSENEDSTEDRIKKMFGTDKLEII